MPCSALMPSPVSCRCLAALDVSRRRLRWRLGCELPALLPDGENTFPVPLPACSHIPDSPDSRGTAASWRSSLQVFGFSRVVLLNRSTGTVLSPGSCCRESSGFFQQWPHSGKPGQVQVFWMKCLASLGVTCVLFPCLIPDLCCSRACSVPCLWPGSPRCTSCTAPSAP